MSVSLLHSIRTLPAAQAATNISSLATKYRKEKYVAVSISYVRTVRAQKAFFDGAKSVPELSFFKGHFSGNGKEKGVDVHLAVDMAVGAAAGAFTDAALMTGDADLKYAVQEAHRLGARMRLAVLSTRYPFGIVPAVGAAFVYDWGGLFAREVAPGCGRVPGNVFVREMKGAVSIVRAPAGQ